MPLRILFFGTPGFAVPSLDALAGSSHQVIGVVTQPDRPRGRGQKVVPEAVKIAALARGIPVFQPERLKDPAFLSALRAMAPDLGVVAAYGRILPPEILSLPRLGLINVHASLLPRWRGAAPVHRAILAGDRVTGVTIMRVVQALDAGPMLDRAEVAIGPDETSAELEARLAVLGAERLRHVVDRFDGRATEEPQDESGVTYAPRVERRESAVDWRRPAADVHNHIRGLHPWPLAAVMLNGRRLLLLRSQLADPDANAGTPGTIVGLEKDALVVAAQPGLVRILEVQLEGRAPVGVGAFLHGHRLSPGDRLEPLPDAGR
jgi:methionyl-tRNA formyltransferase